MARSFQLFITLDAPSYTPSALITGALHIKTLDPFNLSSIDLTLTKTYSAQIVRAGVPFLAESHTVYAKTLNLFTAECLKLASGHHRYPFSFYLKLSDNASTSAEVVRGSERITIANAYSLKGDVKVYGAYMPVATTRADLHVVDFNTVRATESLVVEISSCFCVFKRFIDVRSEMDRRAYSYGDRAVLSLSAGGVMRSVDLYFYQVVSLHIGDALKTRCTLLGEHHYDISNNCGECAVDIGDLPSTASEQQFDIKYLIQVVVRFSGNMKIQYKHDIYVVKKAVAEDVGHQLNVMKGFDAALKYFVLD